MLKLNKIIFAAAAALCFAPCVQAAEAAGKAAEKPLPCDVFAAGSIPRSYRAQDKIYFYKTADKVIMEDEDSKIAYIIPGDYFIMSKQKDGTRCAAYMPEGKIKAAGFISDASEYREGKFNDAQAAAFFNDGDATVNARDKNAAGYVETGTSEYSGLFQVWGGYNKAGQVGGDISFYNIAANLIGVFIHTRGCVEDELVCRSTITAEDAVVLKTGANAYIALFIYKGDISDNRHYFVLKGNKLIVDGGSKIDADGGGTYTPAKAAD